MKKIILFLAGIVFLLTSCENSNENISIVPATFSVDIPESLSGGTAPNGRLDESALNGNVIYANLRTFIKVGEVSAKTVEDIIYSIRRYGIDKPMEVKFRSEFDNRMKFFKVEENVNADGKVWQYGLNAWDSQDSILAFQLFWNTNPIKGIAIMNIYDMNRELGTAIEGWMYKVEYSEAESNFEKQMVVSITRPDDVDRWYIKTLKMFAGKKGDDVILYGNTDHPNVWLVDQEFTGGRNYAFVGKASIKNDIGVAQVALPPSSVGTTTNLFVNYSIKKVLSDELGIEPGGVIDQIFQAYFANAEAPGYFVKSQGFISCGSNLPTNSGFSNEFVDLAGLTPYIPTNVKNLTISFE